MSLPHLVFPHSSAFVCGPVQGQTQRLRPRRPVALVSVCLLGFGCYVCLVMGQRRQFMSWSAALSSLWTRWVADAISCHPFEMPTRLRMGLGSMTLTPLMHLHFNPFWLKLSSIALSASFVRTLSPDIMHRAWFVYGLSRSCTCNIFTIYRFTIDQPRHRTQLTKVVTRQGWQK